LKTKKYVAIVITAMTMSISGMAFAGWSNMCSEETNPCECPDNQLMNVMGCEGLWCDYNVIHCKAVGADSDEYWTPAQYSSGTVYCNSGYVPKKLDCHDGYCSGIS
jgi:hypothetical protein